MKSFDAYVRLRETALPASDDNVPINPSAKDGGLNRLISLAWKKHESRMRSFFSHLAKIDPEISAELESLPANVSGDPKRSYGEKDVVCPPSADMGGDIENHENV